MTCSLCEMETETIYCPECAAVIQRVVEHLAKIEELDQEIEALTTTGSLLMGETNE